MQTGTWVSIFGSNSCKQFLVYRLLLDFVAFPDSLSLFVFIFPLLSLSGVFKFLSLFCLVGVISSLLSPFSSFLFYYTYYFTSYWGYFPASHFHLFLDVFLRNREVVVFNFIFSYIFGSIFVYCNLWRFIFVLIQNSLSSVPNVLLKLLKITQRPLPFIFSLLFLRFCLSLF
jgi:hypothetical protein